MKTLPAPLQAHLDTGATTLCHCWKLTRRDGLIFGFTDHDGDIVFDGVAYEAMSGFTASAIEGSLGLAVDNLDASGALQSDRLDADALSAGLFDAAELEIWRVNWQDVTQRVLVRKGDLGEVARGEVAFTAEVRGLAQRLQSVVGRNFQYTCDVDLGSAKCGIDLTSSTYRATATVATAAGRRVLTVTGLDAYQPDWFTRGTALFTSGANAGLAMEVKAHSVASGVVAVELWQPMPFAIEAGDEFTISAGCDKTFATCAAKFANAVNFRGFPHMPGNDYVTSYPTQADANDGGSLNGN